MCTEIDFPRGGLSKLKFKSTHSDFIDVAENRNKLKRGSTDNTYNQLKVLLYILFLNQNF
jgi:hypothetical protein